MPTNIFDIFFTNIRNFDSSFESKIDYFLTPYELYTVKGIFVYFIPFSIRTVAYLVILLIPLLVIKLLYPFNRIITLMIYAVLTLIIAAFFEIFMGFFQLLYS